jgi:hypothetical protein
MMKKDPFVYVPPNATTSPLHAEVRKAEEQALAEIVEALESAQTPGVYDKINVACEAFYNVIERVCPFSSDKEAALRCVIIARMAANEATTASAPDPFDDIVRQLRDNLRAARWQACRAIALYTRCPLDEASTPDQALGPQPLGARSPLSEEGRLAPGAAP